MVTGFRALLIICFALSFAGSVAADRDDRVWHLLFCSLSGVLFIATYAFGL